MSELNLMFKNNSNQNENRTSSNAKEDKLGSSIEFKYVLENQLVSRGRLKYNLILKYQSITCMKEYENKSFEELKFEDYQINRRRSQKFLRTNFSLATTNPFFENTILIAPLESASRENDTSYQKTNQDFGNIHFTEDHASKNIISSSIQQLEDLKINYYYGENNKSKPDVNSINHSSHELHLNNKYNKNKVTDNKALNWNKRVRNLQKLCSELKQNPVQRRTKNGIHPTGIILTRPDYYTIPPLNELTDIISYDGSCIIQGFTVGRHGYGNVYFPDTFDVSNLNLDEIVHFNHEGFHIYPDESKKPPAGQGLNRRSQVTLYKYVSSK